MKYTLLKICFVGVFIFGIIYPYSVSSAKTKIEWDNPNVDWKDVDKNPQKFKGWEVHHGHPNLCQEIKNRVCYTLGKLEEGDKVTVLKQMKIKGLMDTYYKIKTTDGRVGLIDSFFVYLPLKNPKEYKLTPNKSLIRPISTTKITKVKLTSTFNKNKKIKEILKLAKNTNLSYYDNSLHFLDENNTVFYSFQDEGCININFTKDLLSFTLYNNGQQSNSLSNKINKDSKIVLGQLLKPYFPKSYKKLAELYVKQDYKEADKLWKSGNYYKVDGRWVNFGFSLSIGKKGKR
ncbi:hypothetical protein [Heyndrickxia vini]|uniref:Uncharacterized protein n=1 Tax=Heyndrickxia vini TaxID=1476025 RepID=A0ABX7E443_9BACI|nr:hypothetical protein [Heyndrickxia vini]QQZ10015.1 hypothetical protein I5776_03340 [Heyndrickxia vini]